MKITDIKTFVVDCFRTNWAFVKVYTDEGIDGVGEATLEYKEKALVGAVEHIKDVLVGKDPTNIERISHDLYRDSYWRCGPVLMSALSAVETALWDILGKSLGVPVYKLLGGINAMSKAFAIDLGPYGIRSNVVLPGTIKTERRKAMGSKQIVNGELTPIGDISDYEDIANAAFFFGTDLSKNVTGSELIVDGGMQSQLYHQVLNTLKAEKLAQMD